MSAIRVGAVGYLNARPLVYRLDRSPRFDVRYDAPARCAALLHEAAVDLGLIPSIEYQRGGPYLVVPDLAIASRGPVASVALYTKKPMRDVRSIALDTSSRTSVALLQLLCARRYRIAPELHAHGPDPGAMLARHDAALIIGDCALFLDHTDIRQTADVGVAGGRGGLPPDARGGGSLRRRPGGRRLETAMHVEKIDLGEAWTALTGLPFVYAFWAGRAGALTAADVSSLQAARDEGVRQTDALARDAFPHDRDRQPIGARYLRDNIKYRLGPDEQAALEVFYRYAAEAGLVEAAAPMRFYR
ncbi:MAG: menaquinone biosynthesis protein [Alphaproteobacteria bacterium]|nr:menaquinone biosynthesis protein [Alphaproteobacteria bacterium]